MSGCRALLLLILMSFCPCWTSWAQSGTTALPKRLELWDLPLGAQVDQLPDEFVDYACATNGSAPSFPLSNWKDFRRCRPDGTGLREVQFHYDDEVEYWARANRLLQDYPQYEGTKAYGFPVQPSALIDDKGVLRGVRLISDPRSDEHRQDAYALKNFLMGRFDSDGWACVDSPALEGETSVDGLFIKQDCAKTLDDGKRLTISVRHLRKSGQAATDPRTGRQTRGQFESQVAFELRDIR